ncbi:hypothetical protein BuS5_00015 [Desulfosarcina sp. BuS5]|nr:hypothetical protein BuS5_00015 [Desulfosarcina sp. BuS5]
MLYGIEQIKEKKYHEKYIAEDKEIFLIGIDFDEQEKNLSKFETEKLALTKPEFQCQIYPI